MNDMGSRASWTPSFGVIVDSAIFELLPKDEHAATKKRRLHTGVAVGIQQEFASWV